MYGDWLRSLKQGWPLILTLSLLIEALPLVLGDSSSTTGGTVVAYAFYAYAIHRYLLLGELITTWRASKPVEPHRILRFIVVSFLFVAIVVAIGFAGTVQLTTGFRDDRFLALFTLVALLANLMLLSLFGTALPAAAVGDRTGLGATLGRTRATFLRIFGGLLLGPGLIGAIGLVALVLLERALASAGMVSGTADFGIGLLARVLGFVNTTFAVVVLCRAYRSVTPASPLPAPG